MGRLKHFLFTNSSTRQTVTKNTVWLMIGEIGSRLIKLVVFAYAARAIGVAEFGLFSYALALMSVFSIFSDIGLNTILLREVAKKSEQMQDYIATGLVLKCVISIISILLLSVMYAIPAPTGIHALIPYIACILLIDSMREYGFAITRAFERMEQEAATKLISNALLGITAISAFVFIQGAKALMIAYIIAGLLALILLFIITKPFLVRITKHTKRSLIAPLFREAWPVGLIAVFATVLLSIDTLILGIFRSTSEIGYYAAMQKPLQLILLVPTLLATALIPFFARSATNHNAGFSVILGKCISIAYIITVPITLICIIFAKPLIIIFFGSIYIPAVPLLKITALSTLATIPSTFLSNALLAYHEQRRTLEFAIIGAVSNITLSFMLIPLYGMYGAAIAFTLSQIIANVWFVLRTRSLPALRFYIQLTSAWKDLCQLLSETKNTILRNK